MMQLTLAYYATFWIWNINFWQCSETWCFCSSIVQLSVLAHPPNQRGASTLSSLTAEDSCFAHNHLSYFLPFASTNLQDWSFSSYMHLFHIPTTSFGIHHTSIIIGFWVHGPALCFRSFSSFCDSFIFLWFIHFYMHIAKAKAARKIVWRLHILTKYLPENPKSRWRHHSYIWRNWYTRRSA